MEQQAKADLDAEVDVVIGARGGISPLRTRCSGAGEQAVAGGVWFWNPQTWSGLSSTCFMASGKGINPLSIRFLLCHLQ